MRFVPQLAIVAASSLALTACGGAGGGNTDTRDFVRVVGSSTVYPFATAVAEAVAKTGIKSPVIESTGTGSGIKLFCAGVGASHPDIVNASRRMKASEYESCAKNGVKDVVEIQVGLDGIAFALVFRVLDEVVGFQGIGDFGLVKIIMQTHGFRHV
jgi:phosphate transport system substrate-binding protein